MTLSSTQLAGLLAEHDRQLVVAAVLLGNSNRQAIAEACGLDTRAITKALERLVAAGLVYDHDGELKVRTSAFKDAARAEALTEPDQSFEGTSADEEAVLNRYLKDGKLVQMPAKWSYKVTILDWVVQRFTPGRRYNEAEVNALLSEVDPDTATLRRYLVEAQMMDRADGEYWRSGGSVRL